MSNKPTGFLSKLLEFFIPVVVVFIVALIISRSCNKEDQVLPQPPKITVVHDTTYIIKDSVVYSKPGNIKEDTLYVIDTVVMKDTVCIPLYKDYVSVRVYNDSLKIKDLGVVNIIDTVTHNRLAGRKYDYKFSIPVVKDSVTVIVPPVYHPEFYVGGHLNTQGIHAGILYKTINKQYGATVGLGTNGKLIYGIQSYWKLK